MSGMDSVISLRPSSHQNANAFRVCGALPGSPCARTGTLAERLKRNGECKLLSSVCSGDGSRMGWIAGFSLYPGKTRHSHFFCHNQISQSHHTDTFADVCCHSRLSLGFAATDGHGHVFCESSLVQRSNPSPSADWDKQKTYGSNIRMVDAGVGLPLSLRVLKRQKQEQGKGTLSSGLIHVESSLLKAFSSIVYMMKELQTHCLRIQRQFFNQKTEGLLNQAQWEIHACFLWLFEQVFSCTPELMVLLMVLLADFTAFSMASSLPMGVTASAPAFSAAVSFPGSRKSIQASIDGSMVSSLSLVDSSSESVDASGWIGNASIWSNRYCLPAAGRDGQFGASKLFGSVSKVPYVVEDGMPPDAQSCLGKAVSEQEDFNTGSGFSSLAEDDDYTCYARTDLAYQYALTSNASNSMLLSNYAQFLFLVRKDHDRAEELFRRAVLCDPSDGDAISRFARFLWIARRNRSGAGKAYQAAVSADPSNSFHAADYAHFLWNAGQ